MRILFVYGSLFKLGGIQTWLARTVPMLAEAGHEVAILTREAEAPGIPHLVDEIAEHADLHFTEGKWYLAPRSLRGASLEPADVIVPCNFDALLLACIVHERLMPGARLLTAVFSPREYCWHASRWQRRWVQRRVERVLSRLPDENLLFATDGMKGQTGECLGRELQRSPVLPVGIDTARLQPRDGNAAQSRKIVSIQRLASYYTYHPQMIHVIRELRDRGLRFEYYLYGEGEARAGLESLARELGVDDAVFLPGMVEYERLAEVVADAFVYVGNGTGMLEAAACGVPALVAIDSHPGPFTHGFLSETEGNHMGGIVPGHEEHPIAERIAWLTRQPKDRYHELERATRERALEFSLDRVAPQLIEILEATAAVPPLKTSPGDKLMARADEAVFAAKRRLGLPDAMQRRYLKEGTA